MIRPVAETFNKRLEGEGWEGIGLRRREGRRIGVKEGRGCREREKKIVLSRNVMITRNRCTGKLGNCMNTIVWEDNRSRLPPGIE